MYLDKQLQDYLDDLASARPTPGGGSTAALSGAMGSALACMVSRLTLSKADYAPVHAEIERLLAQAEQLRSRFQSLMQADIEAYGHLSATFKLPRTTSEEKAARMQAIQDGLVSAALVPLEMAESAAQLVQCCLRIAEIGNKNVLSDIATATSMATGAGRGASWMVQINLQSMKDQGRIAELSQRLETALAQIEQGTQQVIRSIEERA
ncbi:cyclodeaminase/cyclohydrolase family protein [Tengunoibacter tsumagoiensis]|uniref:Formiminotransferase-cyclodeaminase n=1 Tax=Tengunoibacter tsumagoiensis TaxID=2014871 RepID=A0A402A233_9CHLR|nr:cyclodeaminase/cyclohydrolase family protein [Tengunoibacter tsumagoiensis]GCE13115.1 formiminotransferase-cyclodeaminase [Tengunoibacter tsumagoiensis]